MKRRLLLLLMLATSGCATRSEVRELRSSVQRIEAARFLDQAEAFNGTKRVYDHIRKKDSELREILRSMAAELDALKAVERTRMP